MFVETQKEKIASPKHTYYSDKYSASLPTYMSHKQTSASHSVLDWEIQPKRNFKLKKQLQIGLIQ